MNKYQKALIFISVGLEVALINVGSLMFGRYLDRLTNGKILFTLVCVVLGFLGTTYHLIKIVKWVEKREKENG